MIQRTKNIVIVIHAVYMFMEHGVQMTLSHNGLFVYLFIVKLSIVPLQLEVLTYAHVI